MDTDKVKRRQKRKAPTEGGDVNPNDPEAGAYNENAKDRFKAAQADAEMQFEDDFEDEFEDEEIDNAMDVADNDDEDPQDDILPDEPEEVPTEVRRVFPPSTALCSRILLTMLLFRSGAQELTSLKKENTSNTILRPTI